MCHGTLTYVSQYELSRYVSVTMSRVVTLNSNQSRGEQDPDPKKMHNKSKIEQKNNKGDENERTGYSCRYRTLVGGDLP